MIILIKIIIMDVSDSDAHSHSCITCMAAAWLPKRRNQFARYNFAPFVCNKNEKKNSAHSQTQTCARAERQTKSGRENTTNFIDFDAYKNLSLFISFRLVWHHTHAQTQTHELATKNCIACG